MAFKAESSGKVKTMMCLDKRDEQDSSIAGGTDRGSLKVDIALARAAEEMGLSSRRSEIANKRGEVLVT